MPRSFLIKKKHLQAAGIKRKSPSPLHHSLHNTDDGSSIGPEDLSVRSATPSPMPTPSPSPPMVLEPLSLNVHHHPQSPGNPWPSLHHPTAIYHQNSHSQYLQSYLSSYIYHDHQHHHHHSHSRSPVYQPTPVIARHPLMTTSIPQQQQHHQTIVADADEDEDMTIVEEAPPSPYSSSASTTSKDPCDIDKRKELDDTTVDITRGASKGSQGQGRSKRYQCPDCGKSYSTVSGVSKHQQFHCGPAARRSFSCKFCEKVYVSLGALKMHIRTHTLPCKCALCGKAFSRPWLLQGHIRTHTGEKPFSCQHCQRAFADRSNLRAHLQTHSDIKKYSCKTCHKTFSRISLLTKHEDSGCTAPQASANCHQISICP